MRLFPSPHSVLRCPLCFPVAFASPSMTMRPSSVVAFACHIVSVCSLVSVAVSHVSADVHHIIIITITTIIINTIINDDVDAITANTRICC